MGEQAARAALIDAGLEYSQVQQAHVGYVYGDSTSGQAALYGLGQTGIPIFNVNNNCSTGSWALWLARQAVASGTVDCALALGFEQMVPGALASVYSDRPNPLMRFETVRDELQQVDPQADQGRRQRRPARHDDRIDPAGPARHPDEAAGSAVMLTTPRPTMSVARSWSPAADWKPDHEQCALHQRLARRRCRRAG